MKSGQRWLLAFLLPILLSGPIQVLGQQFRIESSIYTATSQQPVSENLTLFDNRSVYDFLFDTRERDKILEVAIYRMDEQKLVLLDNLHRRKLEIYEAELTQLMTALRSSEAFKNELQFLVDPEFVEEFDPSNHRLELRAKQIVYVIQGEKVSDDKAWANYIRFLNAYTLLNATDPRKLPPFARMQLNRSLESHRIFPTQVEMTLDLPDPKGMGAKRISAISKHGWIWSLSENDRRRIETANQWVSQYSKTTLSEFRHVAETNTRVAR